MYIKSNIYNLKYISIILYRMNTEYHNKLDKSELVYKPSIYAHIINSIFILLALIIYIRNYKELASCSAYQILVLVLLTGLVVGIHCLSHLGLETAYGLDMKYFDRS